MQVEPLCPNCTLRPQTTPGGWCDECTIERTAQRYAEEDHHRAVERGLQWEARTRGARADSEAARLRQARHRLLAATRPRSPAPANSDPLELAAAAIYELDVVKHSLKSNATARQRVDDVQEIVRRLGWGPDDETGPQD